MWVNVLLISLLGELTLVLCSVFSQSQSHSQGHR